MTDSHKAPIVKRLASEGLNTLDFFRGLRPYEWEQQIYMAGPGWTVRDILCHLLDAEQAFHHIITDVLRGGSGAPEGMDLDAYNERQVRGMSRLATPTLLESFARARMMTIDIVQKMQESDLERQGRHPFLGITTLEEMLKLIYRHTMIHQRDIRRALEADRPVDAPGQPEQGIG